MLINPFRFGVAPPPVLGDGQWTELGRVTLGSPAAEMDVQNLANKKYLMYLYNTTGAGAGIVNGRMIFNNNFTADYAIRFSTNGLADSTQSLQSDGIDVDITGNTSPKFSFGVISNLLNHQKFAQCWNQDVNLTGPGNVPQRREVVGKMDITTSGAVIDRINFRTTVNTYNAGSQAVILGWDADTDIHNTGANFWQPLSDVTLASPADQIQVPVFTAKKWLFYQFFIKGTTTLVNANLRFNNDSGANYSRRFNTNGTEATEASLTAITQFSTGNTRIFGYGYINNPSETVEKNVQWFTNLITATGNVANQRLDGVGKWANTADQITQMQFDNSGGGDYDTGSYLKVWGND